MRFHFTLFTFGFVSEKPEPVNTDEQPKTGNAGGMEIHQAPPELIAALQAAHARDHQLVGTIQQLQQQLEAQNNLLRQRTVERDHFMQDSHLWSCCLAYLVERDGDSDGEMSLPTEAVNAQEGRMLSARVDDDGYYTRLTVGPRPEASEEGRGG